MRPCRPLHTWLRRTLSRLCAAQQQLQHEPASTRTHIGHSGQLQRSVCWQQQHHQHGPQLQNVARRGPPVGLRTCGRAKRSRLVLRNISSSSSSSSSRAVGVTTLRAGMPARTMCMVRRLRRVGHADQHVHAGRRLDMPCAGQQRHKLQQTTVQLGTAVRPGAACAPWPDNCTQGRHAVPRGAWLQVESAVCFWALLCLRARGCISRIRYDW
jgi:hypothetical protein